MLVAVAHNKNIKENVANDNTACERNIKIRLKLNIFIDLFATWGVVPLLQTKQYFKRRRRERGAIFYIAPLDDFRKEVF